jgi:hypothetical protein
MTDWSTVGTVTNATGTFEYRDSAPMPTETEQLYYRAKLVP